ncbi:LCP family protein [Virgibacillus xinjiangensis]|uniref:LCP family protein n=1 Tax=Virgibacillus xinjiangensis TaxID=393090 RepID=A0ABV7CUM2_9BACI
MARKRPKSLFSIKKILAACALLLLLIIGTGAGYALSLYQSTSEMVEESHQTSGRENETSDLRDQPVDPVEDNVSVLFIGVDNSEHRDQSQSRSDALLLATFNKDENSVKLLSIPRDSYTYIPEVGYSTKINHAHAFGGAEATIETVEQFMKVPVDYYVQMNFDAFVDVVNAIGGITYDVPYEFKESDSDDDKKAIHLYPGVQRLNGEEALAMARTRKHDSDLARGQRQQEILKAIVDKATSSSSVFKIDELVEAVGNHMETNLTFPEMRGFLSYGLDENVEIDTMQLDGSGGFGNNGAWYYYVNEENKLKIQETLQEHLELQSESQSNNLAEDDQNDNNVY